MLAEESVVSVVGVASGAVAVTHVLVVESHDSPVAQAQFGAVLLDSKQEWQDLAQLEEQVAQP